MTIEEAIKRLTIIKESGTGLDPGNELSALKLGIEALKRWEELEESILGTLFEPLPGETKE